MRRLASDNIGMVLVLPVGSAGWNERGAHVVTTSEGGQALDVHPEQAREGLGLGLAEGGELRSDVLHGAVTLAQLDAGEPARAHRPGGGGKTVVAEGLHEGVSPLGGVVTDGSECCAIPLLSLGAAGAGELGHRLRAGVLGEVTQHLHGQGVIVGLEGGVPGLGHDVGPSRAASPATSGSRFVGCHRPLLHEGIEVAAHRCRGQVETPPELGRRDGAFDGDRLEHPRARAQLEPW